MSLVTIEELEAVLGYDIPPEDVGPTQFLLDKISDYITTYTGIDFTLIEDDEIRCVSDYYGEIDLPGPVIEITSVLNWRDQSNVTYWDWDGVNKLFNFYPAQTVDVTYTHGYDAVPQDIKNVCFDMASNAILAPRISELTLKTVGDVSEKFAAYSSLAQFMDDFSKSVLESYKTTEWTTVLGRHTPYSSNRDLPTL